MQLFEGNHGQPISKDETEVVAAYAKRVKKMSKHPVLQPVIRFS